MTAAADASGTCGTDGRPRPSRLAGRAAATDRRANEAKKY
jgi:hypothetical protein